VGGRNGDRGNGIPVDSSGNAYITGYVHSKDFPTVSPVQAAFAGGNSMKRFRTPRHYHQGSNNSRGRSLDTVLVEPTCTPKKLSQTRWIRVAS